MRSYVVIGLGLFGSRVARQLCELGSEVLAVDIHADLIQEISGDVTNAVVADARDQSVLKALGVESCECAIVAIGDDFGASVLVTMNLKELGVPYIVCKAHDDTHRRVLQKLGADKVVTPEREVAERLAHSLYSPNVLDFIELSDDYGIVEVPVPKSWTNKSIIQLNVRARHGVNIIAVESEGKVNVSPSAQYVLKKEDILVVLGDYDSLAALQGL